MPISLSESENPAVWNNDPLSNYTAFYYLLDDYRCLREEDKLLVSKRAFIAAQRILDIDEDVKETYGNDTEDLDVGRSTCAGLVAYALNHYRRKIRLYGWAIEPKVVHHAQIIVDEGRESDEIEERQREELLACRSSLKAARGALLSHLASYVATLRKHNETHWGGDKLVDERVLAAVEAISKWADGHHEKVTTDKFLRSENLRDWGYAGYTAKIASIYYWTLRKTNEVVDREVLLAVKEVMDLAEEIGEIEQYRF